MEILPASFLDLNALRKLSQACFGSDAWSLIDLISVLSYSDVIRLKTLDESGMTGIIAGDPHQTDGLAWVSILAVDPRCQRQGIGTALLREYESRVSASLMKLTVRMSNHQAIALYEKEGYRSVDIWKRYYNNGEDGLVMAKNL